MGGGGGGGWLVHQFHSPGFALVEYNSVEKENRIETVKWKLYFDQMGR